MIAATCIAAAATAAYWLTFQPDTSWDALEQAIAIRDGSWTLLIEPNHPLGTLIAAALHAAAASLGVGLDALSALRLAAAVCGGAALGLLFFVLRRSGAAQSIALGATIALGGSWAFWQAASLGTIYPASALALCVAGGAFLLSASPLLVGAASALAILGHQQNALLVPFVALAYLSSAGRRRAGVYLAACGAALAAAYASLWLASDRSSPLQWIAGYVGDGFHFPRGSVLQAAGASLVGAASGPPALRTALGALLVFGGGVCLLLAALRGTKAMIRRAPRPDALPESAFAGATLAFAGAAIWWEPQTLNFWVAVVACGWLTLGLLARRSLGGLDAAFLALAIAIPAINLGGAIERSRSHDNETIARRIGGATRPEDLLVVGTDLLGPSLRYHGERPHATTLFAVWYRAKLAGEQGSTALQHLVDESRSRAGRVFVASNALDLDRTRRELAGMTALGTDTAALFPRARLTSALRYELPRGHQRTLYEVLPVE